MAGEKENENGGGTEPKPTIEQTAISAFDAGIENPEPVKTALSDEEASGHEDGKQVPAGAGGQEPPAGGEAGKTGEPAAGAKGGEGGAPAGEELTDEQKAAADAAKADEAAKKAAVDEANSLNLRGRANERFVQLAEQGRKQAETIKAQGDELTALREAFGVPADADPAGAQEHLKWMAKAAADQIRWDAALQDIGGTPQQFGDAMGIIKAFNSNDPKLLADARTNMLAWVGQIDVVLGEETDRYNPLSEFPDLLAKVESGAMDKADALETAKLRRAEAARAATAREQSGQDAAAQAEQAGLNALAALGRTLKAKDGEAVFAGKMAIMRQQLEADIKAYGLHPSKWAGYAEQLYARTVYKAPERPPIPGGKQPMRQQTPPSNGDPLPKPKNAVDAFDIGVEEARRQGR